MKKHVSLPSIRPACDPKLAEYAKNSNDYNSTFEVERDVLSGVRIIGLENFVFKITREARCLDSIECPVPLDWSSWNCHCPSEGDNFQNLKLCGCNAQDRIYMYSFTDD